MNNDPVLSEREREILRLVATGASNKQIAQELYISANTVKVHMRNIFAKIGVVSRTEATLYAIREGLVAAPVTLPAQPAEEDEPGNGQTQVDSLAALNNLDPTLAVEHALPTKTILHPTRWRAAALLGIFFFLAIGFAGVVLRPYLAPTQTPAPSPVPTLSRWEERAPMPEGRAGLAAAVYENAIYAIAGETEKGVSGAVTRYDPDQDAWTTLKPKPVPVTDVGAVTIGGKIYVPGGRLADGQPTDVLEVYDPRLDAWSERSKLPVKVSGYAIAALEGKLYLFGGWDGQKVLAEVYEYDPGDDDWTLKTPMPTARAYSGAAVVGGKIYVIGGWDGEKALAVNEVYAPERDDGEQEAWKIETPLPEGRYEMGVTGVADTILLLGGVAPNQKRIYTSFQYFPIAEEWQIINETKPELARKLSIQALSSVVYLFGGKSEQTISKENHAYRAMYLILLPLVR